MSVTVHDVKSWEPYFSAVGREDKTFDLRKEDRGYRLGDILRHRQTIACPTCGGTGTRENKGEPHVMCNACQWNDRLKPGDADPVYTVITYIMRGAKFGLAPGYVAMSIKLVWPYIIENDTEEGEAPKKKIVYLKVRDLKLGSKHCPKLEPGQTIRPMYQHIEPSQLPLFDECAN